MLTALKYKDKLLEEFYLDSDDITIRRKKDGYYNRFKEHSVVKPFILKGEKGHDYKGIHIPKTRATISLPWLLTILRGIPFTDKQVVDHLDGDITNNSRSNIRVTTQKSNSKNRKKHSNNTSGYTGISWNDKAKLYYVRRTINGKRMYKSSKTLEEAIIHLDELTQLGLIDGYTARHGK